MLFQIYNCEIILFFELEAKILLPDLYVVMITRDYPTDWAWCLPISSAQIPYADPIAVIQRSYL